MSTLGRDQTLEKGLKVSRIKRFLRVCRRGHGLSKPLLTKCVAKSLNCNLYQSHSKVARKCAKNGRLSNDHISKSWKMFSPRAFVGRVLWNIRSPMPECKRLSLENCTLSDKARGRPKRLGPNFRVIPFRSQSPKSRVAIVFFLVKW